MEKALPYVVVTPARNEAQFIELTLRSMIAQTRTPLRWVIVSDGSTDATDAIVGEYLTGYPWIELIQMPERRERNFAGKADAVNAGRERVAQLPYEVIVSLDADVSFDPDYFEFLLGRFAENSRLGVGGTAFLEGSLSYNYEFVGSEHVSGMCQAFRRECFEAIDGYSAIKSGGIDLIAVLSARAKGWETRTFAEKKFIHHRTQGGALHSGLRERFYTGRKDYLLGNHPLWEVFRSLYQMTRKPYVIGGLAVLTSYSWNALRNVKKTMPKELMRMRRSDQMTRLKRMILRRVGQTA